MLRLYPLRYGLLLGCVVCSLLLADQARGQDFDYKTLTNEKLELELNERKARVEKADREIVRNTADLHVLQRQMEEISAKLAVQEKTFLDTGFAPEAYAEVLVVLQTMRVQLQIDLAGLRARQEYLRQTEANNPGREKLLIQLHFTERKLEVAQKIAEINRNLSEQAEQNHAKGVISTGELNKAKVDAENASMKVLELEGSISELQASMKELESPPLASIQQTGLEIAEKEARLKQVEEQLKAAAEVNAVAMQSEVQRRMLHKMEADKDRLLEEISEYEVEKRYMLTPISEIESELARRKKDK